MYTQLYHNSNHSAQDVGCILGIGHEEVHVCFSGISMSVGMHLVA